MLYFDANATTPCAPEVVEAMRPFWEGTFANASSPHRAGRLAAQAVSKARRQVAESIEASPHEIVFTSGATEGANLIFWGLLLSDSPRRKIFVSAIEHKAVLESAALLGRHGFDIVQVPVTEDGLVNIDYISENIDENTALVAVQAANNEIGTIQPIQEITALAHDAGAFIYVDAVQALGKMPVSMMDWQCDFATFSAHKIYGPKGVGALYVHGGPLAWPWPKPMNGGSQEGGLRPGTLNVPGIVGFGAACQLLQERQSEKNQFLENLRNILESELIKRYKNNIIILGQRAPRIVNTSAVMMHDISADMLLSNIQDVMLSTSSACSSSLATSSHVVMALGYDERSAHGFIRISLPLTVQEADVLQFLSNFEKSIREIRKFLGQ